MKKNYTVIDTNVFISAIIGQNSYPRKIFDDIILQKLTYLCLSKAIWEEYQIVCQRTKFSRFKGFEERAKYLLDAIKTIAIWFEPQQTLHLLPDEDDNKFIELAVEAEANYIVSGNTRDFVIDEYNGILFLNPKDYYQLYFNSST